MKRLLFSIFSLLISWLAGSQPICQITEYTTDDGLSQDIVSGLIQDQKGMIWLCTRNGLNKFDGYTFRNYKSSPHEEYTLSNNRITFISETTTGDIWCQAYDSKAYIFDTHRETFFDVLLPVEKEIKRKNLVQKIIPLSKGVAWLICDKGYCYRVDESRYREKEGITLYSTFDGVLKGEQVFTVFEDAEKDEWILTDKGITIVGNKKIESDFPFRLIHECDNRIYLVSTSEKLACYLPEKGGVSFIDIPYSVGRIHALDSTREGVVILATDNGIVLYDPSDQTFRRFDIRSPKQPSGEAVSVFEDRSGELWVFPNAAGIVRLHIQTGEMQYLYTPEKEVVKHGRENRNIIFEDKQGNLWLTPNQGNFSYYDRDTKQLKAFYTDPQDPQSLFTPLIRYYTEDKQGNLWLITSRGVQKMSFYPQVYNMKKMESDYEVRSFLSDSSHCLWVASKSEYIRIYHPDGTLRGYLTPQGKISKERVSFNASVYCMHEDADQTIWIGTKNDGLFRLTPDRNGYSIQSYTHRPGDLYSISHNDIYSIFRDSHNQLWIGCYGGGLNLLQQLPEDNIQFINHRNKLKNFPINEAHNIRYITESSPGILLLGTTQGLITFSGAFTQPEEIKFYRNIQENGNAKSLIGNDVMHIYESSDRQIYVLSFTGGVNKILSQDLLSEALEFTCYTEQQGLNSDMVLSMVEDDEGFLWIVCENALSRFDPRTERFENYNTSFLRQKLNFTEAIPATNASGQLIFGTDMGMVEITPGQMSKSEYVPPILFTDVRINGEKFPTSTNNLTEITFRPSERNINIQFVALDYTRPEEIRYAYYLKGLEKEWNYSDNNRVASYINLPAGTYQLHVKSTNSDGVWTDNTRILSIRVLPTFRETPWAWLTYLLVFLLLSGIILYVLFYIYRLRHQVDVEHQLSNIKLKFFTDVSHELRTPLTLISSPVSEVLEHEELSPSAREHLTVVHKNTDRMLRLVNQILDFRKIQNEKMKLLVEETELIVFLMKITESFRLMAEEKQISLALHSEQEELYVWIDRDKVEKIIFNLLSNAFKYTLPGKAIKVMVEKTNETFRVCVVDEGIGIAPEKIDTLFKRFETQLSKYNILQPSSGIGLSLVKELVELHHGSIEAESQPEVGSCFSVTLPLERNIYEKDSQTELILNDGPEEQAAEKISVVPTSMEADTGSESEEMPTLLIVEDNPELRNLLLSILKKRYMVLEAVNGEEGLNLASQTIPDLIISDVMMPVMDGLEMVKHIKENRDTSCIPIILLSAKSSLDDRIKGLENGIDDYITKPFSSTYLKARITSLLEQRKQLQELFMSRLSAGDGSDGLPDWQPSQPNVIPHDELFMEKVMEFMEEQMDNPNLVIDDFANKLFMSRSFFYRKLKSIVGMAPIDFIREIRVKRAAQLIKTNGYNFSQIAYMTGFNDPKYFSRCFKKHMGMSPTEYKNSVRQE